MTTRLIVLTCLSVLSDVASADEEPVIVVASHRDGGIRTILVEPNLPHIHSGGPSTRWCITRFIAERRQLSSNASQVGSYSVRSNNYQVPTSLSSTTLADRNAPTVARAADAVPSLYARLKALAATRTVTLWRGNQRDLVAGLQRGGYFGLTIKEAPAKDR